MIPILVQYGRWIWNAAHGDLGESYIDDKPVLGEILRLLPNTLLLSGMALLVITVVGLAGGLLLTLFRDKFIDLLGRVLLVFLMSIPGFCLAYFMIWLFAQKLRILPTSGAETLSCFLMPCLAISIGSACVVIRLLRSSILGELSKNYILTRQAKGLREGPAHFPSCTAKFSSSLHYLYRQYLRRSSGRLHDHGERIFRPRNRKLRPHRHQ